MGEPNGSSLLPDPLPRQRPRHGFTASCDRLKRNREFVTEHPHLSSQGLPDVLL